MNIPSNTFPKARLAALKELAAELALLRLYNDTRVRAGHDFGNGARWAELARRQRALEEFCSNTTSEPRVSAYELERDVAEAELTAAYDRVGKRRHDRAQRDFERYGSTGARKTRNAWDTVARYVEPHVTALKSS